MELLERTKCVVSHKKDLEHLYTFKNFPVFMGCTEEPECRDLMTDMIWDISQGSGMIQLRKLIPLDILYQTSHDAGAVGASWLEHHKAFAKFIMGFSPSTVFEIGGGHGILAREANAIRKTDWTILEANPPALGNVRGGARYIKGFFDRNFRFSGPFDAIVHSHVFEHMYDIDEFIRTLANFMDEGKNMFFSVPNLEAMLKRNYINGISFEHTVFLTEHYIEYLLSRHGFKIIAKNYYLDDHSIFYATIKDKTQEYMKLKNLYEYNKSLFNQCIYYYENLIKGINEKIFVEKKPVYLFGAHGFSQMLMGLGLNISKIVSILDNSVSKQGKRLYGTKLMVESPKILKGKEKLIVILHAGVFNEEIKADILKNINSKVEFW